MGILGRIWALGLALATGFALGSGTPASGREARAAPGHETQQGEESPLIDGTAAMVERLAEIARGTENHLDPYANRARVAHLRQLPSPTDPAQAAKQRLALASELIFAGETLDGITLLEEMERQGDRERLGPALDAVLALGYLRLGEQQNCLLSHTADACLVPIGPAGVHRARDGSQKAIEVYERMLAEHPEDLTLRWLLNLAYMTLGEHPREVPEAYLVPPEVFASETQLPRLRDRAPELGLATTSLAGGVVLDDLDRDGDLDVLVSSWGRRDSLRLFLRDAEGRFVEHTRAAGLEGLFGGLNLVHGDVDGDGHLDVFVPRGSWLGPYGHHPNSLLRNRGDGTFEDVTESAGLLSFHPTQTAVFGDVDNDGDLDLFVGNETWRDDRHACELFLNRGDGTFVEVARRAGLDHFGFVKGAAFGDVDDDGDLDLYLSQLGAPNLLLRNQGPADDGIPRFVDMTAEAGVAEPVNSFPTWFFDFDNDGDLDLFVSGYGARVPVEADGTAYAWEALQSATGHVAADYLLLPSGGETPRLYRNRGDGTFADATAKVGLDRVIYTMGANFGDLDGDGWLDLYLATGETRYEALMPNRLLRNDRGERVLDGTTATGTGHIQKGHGVAFGDVDRDGDQDLFAVMGGAFEGDLYQNVLFENPGMGQRWLHLELEGRGASRDAQGARVRVRLETPEGPRQLHRVVGSGGSFGASSLQLELGLGQASAIEEVQIRWPAGQRQQTIRGLVLDRAYRIVQGRDEAQLLDRPPIALPRDELGPAHEHAGAPESAPRQQ